MADQRQETLGEELLVGLATIVAESAARVLELDPELAKLLADDVATRFSEDWGGDTRYIPKGRVFRNSALYRQIWDRFTGSNQRALAKELGFSLPHIYHVIKMQRERDRAERQKQLPGLAE